MMAATAETLIKGPQPMAVVAPLGSTVTLTCVVNTTELPAGTWLLGFGGWIVDGVTLSSSIDQETTNGSLKFSTLQQTVIQNYITGVLVQCQIAVIVSGIPMFLRSNNTTTLTAYGEILAVLCVFVVYTFFDL